MDSIRDQAGEWWVTTGRAKDGGVRLAGPFPKMDDAITARGPMEADHGVSDLWVLDAADPDCPAPGTGKDPQS